MFRGHFRLTHSRHRRGGAKFRSLRSGTAKWNPTPTVLQRELIFVGDTALCHVALNEQGKLVVFAQVTGDAAPIFFGKQEQCPNR